MGKGVRVRNTTVNGGLTGRDEQLGKVFAHKKGSSFSTMKRYTQAGNPNSSQQQAVRNSFAGTSAGWSALTEAQRQLWNDAAPDWGTSGIFGDKKQSGKNLYTGCNVVLALAGMPAILTPSNKAMIAQIEFIFIGSDFSLNATVTAGTVNNTLQLLVSKPQTAGTSKCEKLSILKNFPLNASRADEWGSEFVDKFGNAPIGSKVFYEVRAISQGGNVSTLDKGYFIV